MSDPSATTLPARVAGPGRGNELDDDVLRREIELVADLVVAASDCWGNLSAAQVDEILDVPR